MWVLKVKVISWPWPKVIYIWKLKLAFLRNDWAILNQILFCAWPKYQVSVSQDHWSSGCCSIVCVFNYLFGGLFVILSLGYAQPWEHHLQRSSPLKHVYQSQAKLIDQNFETKGCLTKRGIPSRAILFPGMNLKMKDNTWCSYKWTWTYQNVTDLKVICHIYIG